MKNLEMKEAYQNGGYRERTMMETGSKKVVYEYGHKLLVFETLKSEAIYDATDKMWIA